MCSFIDWFQHCYIATTLLHCLFNNFGFTLGKPQSERKISDASSFRPVPVQWWTFWTNNRQSKKWRNAVSSLARIWKIPHLYPGWSFVLSSRVIYLSLILGWAYGKIYLQHVWTRGGRTKEEKSHLCFSFSLYLIPFPLLTEGMSTFGSVNCALFPVFNFLWCIFAFQWQEIKRIRDVTASCGIDKKL